MSEKTIPVFSIILVTFNSENSIVQSLQALKSADLFELCETIIVDNASTDDSLERAISVIPDVKIIQQNYNAGFAKACNRGALESSGRYLLFYNPDLEIDRDALVQLQEFLEKEQNAGAVSGRMRFPDGSFQATCRKFPNMQNIFISRGSFLSRFLSKTEIYTLPDYDEITEVDAVAGTMLAVSREKFMQVKMFDERFFMYMEDSDLSYKLHLSGFKNFFLPKAGGVHLWGKGSKAGHIKRAYYHHLSVWKYYLKHFPGGFSIIFLPFVLLGNFLLSILIPKRNS